MSSGSKTDQRGADTDAGPTVASASEAIERQLTEALDASQSPETRFHLRQALQLVKALEE
ncbi:hypothetical protein [Haloplanus natans]|uniref:hypothetical protein n=1 Tax=Haloplanus natans TaxID=376171 RepID=UPI0006779DE9|nr:hypothetical protein [Haloplanus natans]